MPEPYRVNITRRALADIEGIHQYIEQDSPQNAAEMVARLIKAIDSLALFPDRYPVYSGRAKLSQAVRRMPVRPDLIYYRVVDRVRGVDVITVRHGRRRQPRGIG